jgi:hypothetical protein
MNSKSKVSGVFRYLTLILVSLVVNPLAGQQTGQIPVITIVTPQVADSLNTSGRVLVSAEIVSGTALQTFRIMQNEKVFASETMIKPKQKDNNTYIIESLVPLTGGLNTIYIEAKNPAGIAVSGKRIINYHLEPFITWVAPPAASTTVQTGTMKIRAEIRSRLPLQKITMNFNGSVSSLGSGAAKLLKDDIYILETAIEFKTGKNSVYITANNSRGETRSATRTISFGSAPAITFVSPSLRDSVNNAGTIVVSAEIVSHRALESFRIIHNDAVFASESNVTPKQKDSITYIIESLIPLNGGLNTVYIEAKNSAGTTVSEKRAINFSNKPFITWIVPASATATVESGNLNLKAEIKTMYPLQKVNINVNGTGSGDEKSGVSKLTDDTYILEKVIKLNAGKNTIFISAGNAKGETRSATRAITFGSAPKIILLSPSSADSLNTSGRVIVRAEIISSVPIQSFKIVNNGSTVINETGTKPTQKDDRTYVYESLITVDAGSNAISVEAKNSLGTTSSEKRTVFSQSKPFITWILPESENTTTESGTLNVSAQIRSSFEIQNVSVNLNGTIIAGEQGDITRLNDGTYLFKKSLPNILSTKNTISLSATNLRGITNSDSRSISYMAGAKPVITIASMDSLNNSGIVLFSAEVVSRTKLQAVRLIQNGTVVITETTKNPEQKDSITYVIKGLLPLKAGTNTFFVEAINTIGTTTSERRDVICQPAPLIRWITPTATTSTAGSETLKIRAEISTSLDLINVGVNINGTVISDPKEGITRLDNTRYTIERTVTLKEGENSISLVADNARGTGNSSRRSVTYVPGIISEIKWITPSDVSSDTRKAEFPVSASVKTRSDVKIMRLYINGTELTAGDRAKTIKKNTQEYLYENILTLKPGTNTLELSAITSEGIITTDKRTIIYTVPVLPVLAWQNPVPNQSEVNQPSMDIRMNIRSADELNNISVYLNGKALDNVSLQNNVRKENGDFVLGSNVVLKPGDNALYVSAGNIAGLSTSETRTIRYTVPSAPPVAEPVAQISVPTPVPPVITWIAPSKPSTPINLNSAEIRATIKSADKLQSLMVYVNGIGSEEMSQVTPTGSQGEYLIRKTINLQPGDNTLYLAVTNNAGSSKSEERLLSNPRATKPVITWAIPSAASTSVSSDMIVVEACIQSSTPLKEAQIYVNGAQWASETIFPALQSGDCSYRFTKSVLLKEGDNNVIINAINAAGSEMSERRTIRYQQGIAERRLALIMGNSEYSNTLALKNTVNDANLMEATLKTLGFEVIKYLNTNRAQMENAIREFSEKLPNYNVALFYYAGHGIQTGGENYLIPIDAKLDKETDCQWEAVTLNTVVKQFEKVPENINIIILDACRDNPFKSWSRGGPQGFKMLNTVSGTFVAFATGEGQTAADGESKNGTFTEELVKQMVVPQSIFNVFIQTRNNVMKRTNNRQQPINSYNLSGDFWFKK